MVNRLKKLSPEFKKILKLSSQIAASLGYQIYLVGGVVRDLILDREVLDLDIVVEGKAIRCAQKLAKALKGSFNKHHAFGTATVYFAKHKIDFATARTEEYHHWGMLPKVKPATLDEDLFRRDFTLNAMAVSLNKGSYGTLIDLNSGLSDLSKGLIRVQHPKSFLDDPTRILRAIRFEQRFGFRIEKSSFKLLKDANQLKALSFVNPHRLRDELILILKELKPYPYLKRIQKLIGFWFIDKKLSLSQNDFKIFLKVESALLYYKKGHPDSRKLQEWIIYLSGLLVKLSPGKINKILHEFGFRKTERAIVTSVKSGVSKIKKLNRRSKSYLTHKILDDYSFESIIFFYAYYSSKNIRAKISEFLKELVKVRLKVKGEDLKRIDLKPQVLYGKLLKKLLYAKIDKGLKSKKDELREARIIFEELSKKTRGN
jgi:tRNA nucleotidyltransferase (CCA-adding enzyme)